MSVAGKSPVRPLVVGGIAGLILGCIIGLIIGWVVWPVQYVGEAYTYELNEADKMVSPLMSEVIVADTCCERQ